MMDNANENYLMENGCVGHWDWQEKQQHQLFRTQYENS